MYLASVVRRFSELHTHDNKPTFVGGRHPSMAAIDQMQTDAYISDLITRRC